MSLQLCRSLSGAVIRWVQSCGPLTASSASIVPLPFGSGYPCGNPGVPTSGAVASIVPLPFGSGYFRQWYQLLPIVAASIVPLPFGSGYDLRCNTSSPPIDSASIVPLPFGSGYQQRGLQPCGPYAASIVPLPFGSGYLGNPRQIAGAYASFNCAAPFRERLWPGRLLPELPHQPLQLCRSLSGAVINNTRKNAVIADILLQLCRSLSGAVILRGVTREFAGMRLLQLCRSLSGAVINFQKRVFRHLKPASIVPLPFGSGYVGVQPHPRHRGTRLQLCRSLSGAVINWRCWGYRARCCFNCAAPFRERLCPAGRRH